MCRFLCCFLLCQINRAYTRWRYYLFFVFFFVIVWRFTKLVPSLFRSFVFQFTFRLLISMYGECVCVSACMRAYKYVYIYICAWVYVTVCVCWVVALRLLVGWLVGLFIWSASFIRSFYTYNNNTIVRTHFSLTYANIHHKCYVNIYVHTYVRTWVYMVIYIPS